MATRRTLAEEVTGLDALEMPVAPRAGRAVRLWAGVWPKVLATVLALGLWQLVVWSGWRADYVLPGPLAVFRELWDRLYDGKLIGAVGVTMRRAFMGFGLALLVGVVLGSLVTRSKIMRSGVGSMISGLQTMPSIAWFPLAILFFKRSEAAIMFVMVLGAAPAIANAIYDAIGVRIHDLPITPEKVLKALKEKAKN